MNQNKKSYTLPIIVMFALFFMIAFVTNFAGSMGVIVKNQFHASNALSQLGTLANFIAYACMGIPAGIILKRKGYKFTSLAAVTVGFVGVGIQFLSGYVESFGVYVLGAFIAGFSMCMLNIVVNPMLNTLGGGGNKGNQLIQFGGSCNSIGGTIAPILLGYLIGGSVETATVGDAAPAMIIAMAIFALAAVIIGAVKIPEPHMESAEEKAARKAGNKVKDKYSPLSFRHFVLGAVAIFFYVGIEVGIPNIANLYMTTPTIESAEQIVAKYEAQLLADNSVAQTEAEPQTEAQLPAEAEEESVIEAVADPVIETVAEQVEESAAAVAEEQSLPEDAVMLAESTLPAEADVEAAAGEAEEEITEQAYENAKKVLAGELKEGRGLGAGLAGVLVGIYWFLMMCGRLIGGAVGGRISSRKMLISVSSVAMLLVCCIMFMPATAIKIPFIDGAVPLNMVFMVLCGLCTSVMWGSIFNLAAEGLGKYTPAASGIFMTLVCGGGILPFIQGGIADAAGYLTSYWLVFGALCYLLFYALKGSKNVNTDIKTE